MTLLEKIYKAILYLSKSFHILKLINFPVTCDLNLYNKRDFSCGYVSVSPSEVLLIVNENECLGLHFCHNKSHVILLE